MKEADQYEDHVDGIILSIVVKNFFCHDYFEIKFNRNVNYIIGRNGSGKSAFVSALVVGFGGKAAVTSRGTNLTNFIKKGTDSASVAITIKNSKFTAYRHEEFGDSITVIHEFSVSGSSTYKVKSHTGKLMSAKFQDVQDIVVFHNIQVENPISVLNQTEASTFYKSNNAEDLYVFFRRATNFDKTEKYYKEALELCKKADDKWEIKRKAAQNLETDYKRWNTLHERMMSRHEMELKKKALDNEYYWAEVVELERALESAREQQRRHDERVTRLQTEWNNLATRTASPLHAENDQVQAAKAARAAAEQRLQAAQQARRAAEQSAQRRELHLRHLREERRRESRKLQDLRDEIQNMKSGGSASALAELEERVVTCEAASVAAHARLSTAIHTAEQARQQDAHARDLCDEAQERLQRLRAETEAARKQERALQRAGSDSLAVFGPDMAELRRRVDAAVARGAFSEPPKGPVGAYIKLRDRQWGSAFEHILGRTVSTFCTNTDHDARKLASIIKEVYGVRSDKPSVSYSRFQPTVHDVVGAAVNAPGLTCALDAVRIEDPVIANYLIDNLAIETLLLVADDKMAMRLTSVERDVPANLRRVVTRNCAEFFPAPNYRSYGGHARSVRYLHQDVADRTRQVQAELEKCGLAERKGMKAVEEAAATRRAAYQALRVEECALRALQTVATNADAKLEDARAALRLHHAPTHQALEEELRVSQERLKSISVQLEADESREGNMAALNEELRAAADELQRAKQQYKSLQDRAQEEQLKLENARSQAAVLEQRLTTMRAKQASARETLEANSAALETKRKAALSLCERIENPRSASVVLELIEEATARLRAGLGTSLSRAAVGERLVQATQRYLAVQRDLARSKRLNDQIKEVTNQHLKACYKMQKDIVRNVQGSFKCMLALRNYTGYLDVDMGSGKLYVKYARKGQVPTDTSSLSGGERSYGTVALFMALWECIDLPFFFLDEFDVFLDNVNRTAVLELLEDHARRHRDRQFVFLTPLDGYALRGNDFISIFSLNK